MSTDNTRRRRKMENITIRIPKKIFSSALKQVADFIGYGDIGKIYCPGDWNNWGDSPEKAGCIRPKSKMEMKLKNGFYELEIKTEIGFHGFKPAMVKAMPDENGMAPAIWIRWKPGDHPYKNEKEDGFGNWLVAIKPS